MKGTGGIVCAVNMPNASELVNDCLALQPNRGIDGYGIVSVKDGHFFVEKKLLAEGTAFHGYDFGNLPGKTALGFNADYQNVSSISSDDIQPFVAGSRFGMIAITQCGSGSDGNDTIKRNILNQGGSLHSKINSEILLHQIVRSSELKIEDAIVSSLNKAPIAQPLVILTADKLFVIRDTTGLHTLSMGRLDKGFLICSENATYEHLEAKYVGDIKPGEIVMFEKESAEPKRFDYAKNNEHLCICEFIFMGNPRTEYNGILHETFRERLGFKLFLENPAVSGNFILPILNSGVNQSGGFHKNSGIPEKRYLLRSSDRSRTKKNMPYPTSLLYESVRKKSFRKYHLRKDKIVRRHAIVIDCIMRTGMGMRVINERLLEAGAGRISTYIAAPPVIDSCPYDKMLHPSKNYLVASSLESQEQVRKFILSNDLHFLSIESLGDAVRETYNCNICTGCLLGGKLPA